MSLGSSPGGTVSFSSAKFNHPSNGAFRDVPEKVANPARFDLPLYRAGKPYTNALDRDKWLNLPVFQYFEGVSGMGCEVAPLRRVNVLPTSNKLTKSSDFEGACARGGKGATGALKTTEDEQS